MRPQLAANDYSKIKNLLKLYAPKLKWQRYPDTRMTTQQRRNGSKTVQKPFNVFNDTKQVTIRKHALDEEFVNVKKQNQVACTVL
jgi:hypothetical protein